jgi:hypothetical protein
VHACVTRESSDGGMGKPSKARGLRMLYLVTKGVIVKLFFVECGVCRFAKNQASRK